MQRSYNNSTPNQKYKFTSKERDTETDLDYFGARYYDSELGRWTSTDPLASKYPQWSPYNYCKNNPLVYIDPNGMEDVPWTAEDLSESLQNGADGFSAVKRGYRSKKNNVNQAASAAANAFGKTNWQNQKHEHGCYIVYDLDNNQYGFTDFTEGRTSSSSGWEIWKNADEVRSDYNAYAAHGLIIVGYWHQHLGTPDDRSANQFSQDDITIAINFKIEAYATFPNGDVGHFDYGKYNSARGDELKRQRVGYSDNLYNHTKLELNQPSWSK